MLRDKIINIMLNNFSEKGLSASDINALLNIDRTSLYRQLTSLQNSGEILTTGSGRYTTYHLSKDSKAFIKWELSGLPALRKEVFYNQDLLDNYTPNVDYLLSSDQLEKLHAIKNNSGNISDSQYRKVLNFLIIDLAHSSSILEGVNISWIDTKALIDTNEAPLGMSDFDKKVVLNHKSAIKFLLENDILFNRRDVFDIHSLLMSGLFKEDGKEGSIRSTAVTLGVSRYSPISIQDQLSLEFNKFLDKADAIKDPFEKCFFSMVFMPYLQPFSDGNRRTSRLISNISLIKSKLAPFSYSGLIKSEYDFGLLSFYERGRHELLSDVFIKSYEATATYYNDLLGKIEGGSLIGTLDGEYDESSKPKSNKP